MKEGAVQPLVHECADLSRPAPATERTVHALSNIAFEGELAKEIIGKGGDLLLQVGSASCC